MKSYTFTLLFLISLLIFISCQDDDEGIPQTPPNVEDSLAVANKVNINGYIQKGPFINGTAVTISELNDSLIATGKNFNTQIADNKGSFEIRNIVLKSDFVQLTANGFYFDEVKGEKSAAQLTLFALANIADSSSINVNILSHLEKDRAQFLIRQGKTFNEAKKQAQQEILAAFGIENIDMGNSETLDISKDGEGNAVLLAISVILQGNFTVAELSELLANINTDIKEDGKLNSNSSNEKLVNNAKLLNLQAIRTHIEKRYDELGVTSHIPNFEKYIDSDGDGILNGNEDDTPNEFTFTALTDVEVSKLVTSNEITLIGMKEGGKANIAVTNGSFIINGQAITDTVTQVTNGDKIQVAVMASHNYQTTIAAKVKIGSLLKSFEVTTHDYLPDAFAFTTRKDAKTDSVITSETISISGIPYPTPAKVTNGIIIKNGVALTTDTTSLKEGDQVAIQLLSSSNYETSTKATLAINGTEGAFEVVTDDYKPDAFAFTAKENVTIDSIITSETITITGIPYPTPTAITNGTIVKNGTALTSDTTTLKQGDKVAIQLLSGSDYNAATKATLTINGVKGTFEVTTYDYTPDDFSFTPVDNAKRDSTYASNTIILSGLLYPAPVSIENGILIINNKEYSSSETAFAKTGDHITVKLLAGSDFSTKTTAYLYVGSSTNLFEITTLPNPDTNLWTRKTDYPGQASNHLASFVINDKIYVCTGAYTYNYDGYGTKELYEYDPSTDIWTKKADFGGQARYGAVGFSLNGKGYIGFGVVDFSSYVTDFWEYDPATDTWKEIADFGAPFRYYSITFVIDNKAYVGLGSGFKDLRKYDPSTNQWVSKKNFTDDFNSYAISSFAFSLNGKGYTGGKEGFWEYDPLMDNWIKKNNFVNNSLYYPQAFKVGDKVYCDSDSKIYKYDSLNDSWQLTQGVLPFEPVSKIAFSIGGKAFMLTENKEFWEYIP